ncbi:MAG: tRNA uridine-5-carboxymethylaminomethyl(34) synthesis GTPase MnmE [Paracoccus sp. (in: a-proteobacteria)]|uniref:tRNA uridine-5-carboxymethylaminomethyl(34) synthesis GTPase MnmE n=1 Tax=Paracoccus sp. TaxID=267 RepID=UPI0026DEDFFB|nr:tRNA uridine-5-carboxymethylaminomethyl(34) synthesis GTPase MnmE [Paracoccus sp. (in: a-proteobacteria)]MDO5631904.1 tRNA uridine-5-carboxymethylaminomethyl(34) synthesis GTPase MnmE [Paracoccus sp. (in: a-proteobacteria)]
MDTIFAETTPAGRGGVSILRISGPDARKAAEVLAGSLPEPRRAELRVLRDDGDVLDQALVIRFDAGASFTGEDVAELHLHGAPVVVRRVEAALLRQGLRRAEAGEFTRRAFLNGRIDLAAAEGLADLLEAETESQRRQAMLAAGGALGAKTEGWRQLLIRAGALVEVSVDFADEDVPDVVPSEVFDLLDKLRDSIAAEVSGFPAAERLRQGFEVAIVGPPNAGKSSLLNRIARREVALVSDLAGTTRDIIELRLDLRGLAVTLLDTAGLRETDDRVEAMGVNRARERAAAADLRIHLSEAGEPDQELYHDGDLVVRSKADLGGVGISAQTGQGIAELLDDLHRILSDRVAGAGLASHARQAEALIEAMAALHDLRDLPPEMLAEAIRQVSLSLDRLVGRIGAEDYLDIIFSSFCIGK